MRIDDVLQRMQGEYVEMPGLRLTAAQARRLWGLESDVCTALLGSLVDARFLVQTRDGRFVRSRRCADVETVGARKASGRLDSPTGAGRLTSRLVSQFRRLVIRSPGRSTPAATFVEG